MNTQKGFSNLLGLLLFISLVGGGLYLYVDKTFFTFIVDKPIAPIMEEGNKKVIEENSLPIIEDTKEASNKVIKKEIPIACTMDAKQCSDGSYVGRTGPNCEFVCPVINDSNEKNTDNNVLIQQAILAKKTEAVSCTTTMPTHCYLYRCNTGYIFYALSAPGGNPLRCTDDSQIERIKEVTP